MKIKIASDSSSDLTKELIKQNNISVLPFNITMNNNEYLDSMNITPEDIIKNFAETGTLAKTSAVGETRFQDFFAEMVNDGYKVIYFSISSDISSSYDNALRASKQFENVYVVDSRTLSTGIALLMLYACDLVKSGLDYQEIIKRVEERKNSVQASFFIDNLTFLYKGGRCSSLQLLGANLFHIRPCIELKDGKMSMARKYRGPLAKVAENYVKETLQKFNTPDLTRCFITYSTIEPNVLEVVKSTLKQQAHFKEIIETRAGATVTSHCGANTLGILYLNDGE